MDPLDYWRLCDELSVIQAALLIVGADPSGSESSSNRSDGYDATKTALMNAIIGKRLRANVAYDYVEGEDGEWTRGKPDWHQTTIMVEDLRVWLKLRGIRTGFFFRSRRLIPTTYLNRMRITRRSSLLQYRRGRSVSAEPARRHGKSVKQALIIWLRQHGDEYGLTKEDGNPNEQGIEERGQGRQLGY